MSRCFPFPPPGYEKKDRLDDENLLEKEKRKEKKHKKEKKDKPKKDKKEKKDKEGKQKKGKESSDDKRRERKDRKERHKHKKDKTKEKEKQKKRPSEDKITVGPPECSTIDNPGSGCTQSDETSDVKFLVELGKRTRDDDKTTENLVVKKINLTGKICSEYPEKVGVAQNGNSDGNIMITERRINDRKFCGQSNNSNVRGTESGTVQNIVVGHQKKVEGIAGLIGKNIEKRMLHNKIGEHSSSESTVSSERDGDGKRKSGTERKSEKEPNKEQLPMAREKREHAVCNGSNTGSSPLPNEGNKNSNLGKRKELRINGFLHDNEIRPSKLQRPLSCAKAVEEDGHNLKPSMTLTKSVPDLVGMANNHKVNSKLPSSHRNTEDRSKYQATLSDIQFATVSHRTGNNHKVNNNVPSSHSTLENGRTLDTLKAASLSASECYGSSINFKVDNKVRLAHPVLKNGAINKAATRTEAGEHEAIGKSEVDGKVNNVPISRATLENGRTLETLKAGSLLASECGRSSIKHEVDDKVGLAHPVLEKGLVDEVATLTVAGGHKSIGHSKVDNKEHNINGLVKDKRPNGSSTRPSSSTVKQIVKEYPKPPHHDSKYLSKILAIPSIEWSGFDEQEWLLGSNSKSTEANPISSQFKEKKQVWDKALRLDSADITALPYVIPY